jgi:hypothetical protein
MIRPFTLVCILLACGSGLYLYQAKHRVQMLDHEIEKTVRDTNERRERIRVLHAEWTLQNDPQRLQVLADQFLALKTVTPGQFTSLAELDNRLPAVPPPEAASPLPVPASPPAADTPPPEEPKPVPVAASKPPPAPPAAPVAPKPAPIMAAASPPPRPPEREHEHEHETEHKQPPAAPPRPVIAEARTPVRAAPVPTRPMLAAEASRPPSAAPAVSTGSALGMARSGSMSLPRPMPVSASQWVSNGNGGG